MKLYKRNAQGKPIVWEINREPIGLQIKTGLVGGNLHIDYIKDTKIKVDEYESRIKAKRKEGYKEITELKDGGISELVFDASLRSAQIQYLNTYLPKFNTTNEGFKLVMLAKTLTDNKPFDKNGVFNTQYKINGLRCSIGAKRNNNDLFTPIILTYHSREGEDWTNKMQWFDEILLPKINKELLDSMIEEDVHLDGELYIPGYSVNDINSFVKNPQLPQHYQLQYWCYDLEIENISAAERYQMIGRSLKDYMINFQSKEEHLNNKNQLVLLPTFQCHSFTGAVYQRNDFISLGFEGLILRNPAAEYQFGKRNQAMFKFKKIDDGLFEIIDIKEDKRGLPIFVLKNDINDELFECTYNASQEEQKRYTSTPVKEEMNKYLAFVEYRERSGVKQVPFHSKIIRFKHK